MGRSTVGQAPRLTDGDLGASIVCFAISLPRAMFASSFDHVII
jgi:hypothetical protein